MATLPAAAQFYDVAFTAYVRGDYATALRGIRTHAEQGDASAQFNLGVMYAEGKGVPRDFAEAVRWFRRAAEQGHADAQYNLGLLYAKGEGVPRDDAEAVRWFRRSAVQGNIGAQFNLGVMYESGNGVAQNLIQAHKWFNLVVSRPRFFFDLLPTSEQDQIETGERSLDRIAARLSPAGIAEAQRLARIAKAQDEDRFNDLLREWVPEQKQAPELDFFSGSRIADLQRVLLLLGYDPGPADGVLGARTSTAIRAFQADVGLPVTGRVSERLESMVRAALER